MPLILILSHIKAVCVEGSKHPKKQLVNCDKNEYMREAGTQTKKRHSPHGKHGVGGGALPQLLLRSLTVKI